MCFFFSLMHIAWLTAGALRDADTTSAALELALYQLLGSKIQVEDLKKLHIYAIYAHFSSDLRSVGLMLAQKRLYRLNVG